MKLHRSNIIQVAKQCVKTTALLVVPHFDTIIITPRHKQRLSKMKCNSTYGTFVLIELIHHAIHKIVPELNGAIM